MKSTVLISKTEFTLVHVPVREALEEDVAREGGRPITDAALAAAIRHGATDEWRIMARRIDRDDPAWPHMIYDNEADALAGFSALQIEIDEDA